MSGLTIYAVELDGFSEAFVEARTKAAARWRAASECHECGYGYSAFDLIRRGCRVWPATEGERMLIEYGDIHCYRPVSA